MPPYDQRPERGARQPVQQPPRQGSQAGHPPGSQAGHTPGGQSQEVERRQPPAAQDVQTPTLRLISVGRREDVPLGPKDRVLDSTYDHQRDTWEALVVVLPRESESTADEEE